MQNDLVHGFADGSASMRDLLGGKGANLAEMVGLLGPGKVPDGFTITTEACMEYLARDTLSQGLIDRVDDAIGRLEQAVGRRLGDHDDPLLVSVRSGGRVSMPGMMDTVLNLGLGARAVEGLARATGDPRFAWDSYRRLVQMFASVVRSVPGDRLEDEIESVKRESGVVLDTELGVDSLRDLVGRFSRLIEATSGRPFPEDPREQLLEAVAAVFESWNGRRAVEYRRIHRIPDDWGTAVNVQAMVFGNLGDDSGSGVAFSRDELTGGPEPSGDWLANAQGEDVVSGSRNALPLADLASSMPEAHSELRGILSQLERHFGDIQDVEFTIERGRLWILQARTAKRPAQASVRFACDSVDEGLLTIDQALLTIDAASVDALLHPQLSRPITEAETAVRGVAASPGAARGAVAFSAEAAIASAKDGTATILVRKRTEAEDVAGFHSAVGILTSTGGKASHAALVARGMGKPCVCGASDLTVDSGARELRLPDGSVMREGDLLTIDGSSGLVTKTPIPLVEPELGADLERVLEWADSLRTLGVRANADTPEDAARSVRLGAEGIGLCRTEHMFMSPERQDLVRAMILAPDSRRRADALDRLLPLQQDDFERILMAMGPRPVTVRLLDPPLHEFLRDPIELHERIASAGDAGDSALASELRSELQRTLELREANPMLGTRGVRLGLLHPGILAMQVRALSRASIAVGHRVGTAPRVELMVPLVAFDSELALVRESVLAIAAEEGMSGEQAPLVGTMIELPRACVTADRIAEFADFFSFGTNDLTQTALGFSRDDVESAVLGLYLDLGILDRSPFESLDVDGVGDLVRIAIERGRGTKPGLQLGVCGEHGGEPDSIAFFHSAGVDYVSCSPFRVPTARLAAAQALIRERLVDRSSRDRSVTPLG